MKNIFLIFALATLWALGGLAAGAGFSAFLDLQWAIPCSAFNVIARMTMLLLVTRNEHARRLFYEGSKDDDEPVVSYWPFYGHCHLHYCSLALFGG